MTQSWLTEKDVKKMSQMAFF